MTVFQRNKLLINFSSLSLIQATNFLLSIVVIPHLLRKIGADGFGVVSLAQVVMIYLSILTEYGFNQTATRDIAIARNSDRENISLIFSSVFISKIIFCICSFVLLLILLFTVPIFYDHMGVYLLGFSFVIGQTLLINWFFMGMEKMQYIAIPSLIGRVVFVILVFIFIKQKSDSSLFLFFMGSGNIIAALISIYFAFRIYKLRIINPGRLRIGDEMRKGWPITIANFNVTTCQYAGLFILRIFTNDLVVGYYSVAEKIFFAMKIMIGIFTQVAFPVVCRLMQTWRELISFFRRVYLPFLMLVIFCSGCVFILSPQIIWLLVGENHAYAGFLLRMFCVALVIVCLNIPPNLILLADDHRKKYLKIFSIGSAINLLANLILAYFFQATGTVIAVMITEVFITGGLYWQMYRIYYLRLKENLPGR
jgi:PST family polysaccharide transporter